MSVGTLRSATGLIRAPRPCCPLAAAMRWRSRCPPSPLPPRPKLSARAPTAKLPLSFIPNRGQTDRRVRYYAQAPGLGFYLTDDKAVLSSHQGQARHGARDALPRRQSRCALRTRRGAAKARSTTSPDRTARPASPTYGQVVYRELWPGIDMVFRGQGGKLKYEFHLAPGRRRLDRSGSPTAAPRASRWARPATLRDRDAARRAARRPPRQLPAHRTAARAGREPLRARRRAQLRLRARGATTAAGRS